MLPIGRRYAAPEFRVSHGRGLSEKAPLAGAVVRVGQRGRQATKAEADFIGHDGKIYAYASITCPLFDLADPA